MKYDVDLQEMDAIRRARGTCTRKKVLRVVEGNEKKNIWSRERGEEKEKEVRGEGGNIRERLLCYRCHERELFVLSFEEKSEPLLKHILEWLSTGSPVLS